ncbi:MAG: alpha/beta hydrolase family esterase [Methyloligellaceae bacterium]
MRKIRAFCILAASFVLSLSILISNSYAYESYPDLSSRKRFEGRRYILDVPSREHSRKRRPLIIFLHGAMGNARGVKRNLNADMRPIIEKYGVMVAYMNGNPIPLLPRRGTWNAGTCCGTSEAENIDDVGFIDRFIKHAVRRLHADPGRVYLMGHSNGAMMAYRYACEHPRKVAAIVTISGTVMTRRCRPSGLKGVLHIHGESDETVPIRGGLVKRFRKENNFTSVSDTKRLMSKSGVPFKFIPLEDVGHGLRDINSAVNIPITAWRFFSTKTQPR